MACGSSEILFIIYNSRFCEILFFYITRDSVRLSTFRDVFCCFEPAVTFSNNFPGSKIAFHISYSSGFKIELCWAFYSSFPLFPLQMGNKCSLKCQAVTYHNVRTFIYICEMSVYCRNVYLVFIVSDSEQMKMHSKSHNFIVRSFSERSKQKGNKAGRFRISAVTLVEALVHAFFFKEE